MEKPMLRDESKKAENGNELRKKFLAKAVLLRSPLILLFSKTSPSQIELKIKRVFRDETAQAVNGYRAIIFSEAMEICLTLNQRPKTTDARMTIPKEENINCLLE